MEDAVRAGEDLHQEIEVGDVPFDESDSGVVEEVLDAHPAWHGREVVDDVNGGVKFPTFGGIKFPT